MSIFTTATSRFFTSAAVFGLAACAPPVIEQADQHSSDVIEQAEDLASSANQPLPKADTGSVTVHDGVWLGSEAKKLTRGKPLPQPVETDGVTLVSYERLGVDGIADLIQESTGITVQLADDVTGGDGGSGRASRELEIDYEGSLSGFLDQTTARLGLNWTYKDESIQFFRNETRTYLMQMISSNSSSNMSMASAADDGASPASMDSSSGLQIDLWSDVIASINSTVGSAGTVSPSKSLGTISVTGPRSIQDRVEGIIKDYNERLSQQVTVNVQVFNVSMEDRSELGTDFSLDFDDGSTQFGFNSVNSDAAIGNQLGWTLLRPLDGIPSVSGAVRMLDSKGDVSVVTTANATTLNNVPTPIQVTNSQSYISEVTTEIDDETGAETVTPTTEEVTTGFNMQVAPRIVSDGLVALQYNINMSELIGSDDGFERAVFEGVELQMPNINSRAFSQQVMIPNGHTLVLSGFEQTTSRMEKSGVGGADNWFTGGNQSGSLERDIMVVMITPVIVDAGKMIREVD